MREQFARQPGFDPSLIAFEASSIPDEMKFAARWLAWRPLLRNGRITKVPIGARVNDPSSWLPFEVARAKALAHGGGVGFVLGGGLVGVDFDECVDDDGALHPAVIEAVLDLRSYSEVSPSGRGIHILARGTIERPRRLPATCALPARELYDDRRFFATTGRRLPIAPSIIAAGEEVQLALDRLVAKLFVPSELPIIGSVEPADVRLGDDEVLDLLFASKNGEKARRLFEGDTSCYQSASEADLAFVCLIRFFTRDKQQIDAIFRRSRLKRTKWDERHGAATYGELTIDAAIRLGGPTYRRPVAPYAGPNDEGRFGKVHLDVMPTLRLLSKTDVMTYLAYAIHADGRTGKCYPPVSAIAALIGTRREHAQKATTRLRKAGLITVEGKPGLSSSVTLPAYRPVAKDATPPDVGLGGATVRPVSKSATPPVAKYATPKQTNKQSINTGGESAAVSATQKIITPPIAVAQEEIK